MCGSASQLTSSRASVCGSASRLVSSGAPVYGSASQLTSSGALTKRDCPPPQPTPRQPNPTQPTPPPPPPPPPQHHVMHITETWEMQHQYSVRITKRLSLLPHPTPTRHHSRVKMSKKTETHSPHATASATTHPKFTRRGWSCVPWGCHGIPHRLSLMQVNQSAGKKNILATWHRLLPRRDPVLFS